MAVGLAACSDSEPRRDTRFTVSQYVGTHLVRSVHFDCEQNSETCTDLARVITEIRDQPPSTCPGVNGGKGRLLVSGLLAGRTLLMEINRRDVCAVRNFNRLRAAIDEAVDQPFVAPDGPSTTTR